MKFLPSVTLCALFAVAAAVSPALAADEKAKDEGPALVEGAKLMSLLPNPREGWNGMTPTNEERTSQGIKTSRADCVYFKRSGDNPPSVGIAIVDMVRDKPRLDAMLAKWKDDTDPETYVPSRDGTLERLATLSEFPVYEELDPRRSYHQFTVIVAERFLVIVQASDARPEDALAWLKLVDLKKLAVLK